MKTSFHYTEVDYMLNFEYLLACDSLNNLYDFATDICITLYPYIEELQEEREEYPVFGFLIDLLDRLRPFAPISTDISALRVFFRNQLERKIDFGELLHLSRCFIVIKAVSPSGELTLDDEWSAILSNPQGIPLCEKNYLSDTASDSKTPITEEEHLQEEHPESDSNQEAQPIDVPADDEEESEASPIVRIQPPIYTFRPLGRNDSEKRLDACWQKIAGQNFDSIYFWRNRIDTATYNELKDRLHDCARWALPDFGKRYALVLAFYIAEWYKREYNGNNEGGNPLQELGLNCTAKTVWRCAKLPDQLLYQRQNKLFLDSMYYLGGFPIQYLVEKKFETLFREIAKYIQNEGTEQDFGNNCFIHSYAQRDSIRTEWGSLHLYFEALNAGDYPFAPSDYEIEPFKTFICNLIEWKTIRKKFSAEWIIEANQSSEIMRRKLRIHLSPEADGNRHRSISAERIKRWGLNMEVPSFGIYLCYNDDEPSELDPEGEHMTFFNTYDNYFVGQMSSTYFTFHDLPTGVISRIRLVAYCEDEWKELQELDVSPYLQMFETGSYSRLTSHKLQNRSYAIVPYYTKVSYPEECTADMKFFSKNAEPFKMIEISDRIEIKDLTGETITLYNRQIGINLHIRKNENNIRYLADGNLNYFTSHADEEALPFAVPLLTCIDDVEVETYAEDCVPTKLSKEEYTVELKSANDTSFSSWNEDLQPSYGLYKLRITAYGNQRIFPVYLLPAQTRSMFLRDRRSHTIKFSANLPILREENDEHYSTDDNKLIYQDEMPTNTEVDNPDADCIFFKFGSADAYLEIPVYRPFLMRRLYRDDKYLTTILPDGNDRMRLALPFFLKDHYRMVQFDEGGVHRIDFRNVKQSWIGFELKDQSEALDEQRPYEVCGKNVRFYIAEKPADSNLDYQAAPYDADQMVFYYWSTDINDEPVRLDTPYEDGHLHVHLNPQQQKGGLIFQSLENGLCPSKYYRPQLLSEWNVNEYNQEKTAYRCFEIAAQHEVPFRIFEPIYDILKHTDSTLVDLAIRYLNDHPDDCESRLHHLIRLAEELYFSWPLLNRKTWKDMPGRLTTQFYNEQYPGYVPSQPEKEELQNKLKELAQKLFVATGAHYSFENRKALEDFTRTYWLSRNQAGAYPATNNEVWWTATSNGDDRMACEAIKFIRPRRGNARNKGFTSEENGAKRPLTDIRKIIQNLEDDHESFVKIEKFIRFNICNH